MTPIETPLMFAGFDENVLRSFAPLFKQMGVTAVQGGAGNALTSNKPAADWQHRCSPGRSVAGVLVSGDMSVTGLGTVTYNDGKRVLAFGHPFFNLGPVDMPMSKGEVLMMLASLYQPNKLANATEIVGALHQDRHSGIMGVLGEEAPMIPVTVKVRSLDDANNGARREGLPLQRVRAAEVDAVPDDADAVQLDRRHQRIGRRSHLPAERQSGFQRRQGSRSSLTTMASAGRCAVPAPDDAGELVGRQVQPAVPERREDARSERRDRHGGPAAGTPRGHDRERVGPNDTVRPGDEVPVKVFLRPYRGERIERDFTLKMPPGMAKGDHRILLSDADTANRRQMHGGIDEPLHRPAADGVADQPGAQQ